MDGRTGFKISLRIVFNIAHIWNEATQLVQVDLVYEVSAHGVDGVGVLVIDVLVVEEELVSLEQLLLLECQLVMRDVVLHDLRILEVVVTDCLTSEHDHGVLIRHMQTN